MAAAPLPAARQITLPFGTGRKWLPRITSGCAAATAASKMARSKGRRSVMVSHVSEAATLDAVIQPIAAKENPRKAGPAGVLWRVPDAVQRSLRCIAEPGHVPEILAADVAGDDVAEQLPLLALEPLQLKLADRGEISRAGVDHHARQQHFGAEILEVCRLFHDVFASQIVAALLQHLNHGLRDAVADDDRSVEFVAFREILGEEIQEPLHS